MKNLCSIHHGFAWRGRQLEATAGFTENYIHYINTIFQRFWIEFEEHAFPTVIRGIGIKSQEAKAKIRDKLKIDSFNSYLTVGGPLKPKLKAPSRS
jgi:hypothetical protein